MSDLPTWAGILDRIADSQGAERTALVDEATAAVWPELRRMAGNLVARFDSTYSRFGADAESIVGQEFSNLLRECLDTGFRPQAFNALLWTRSLAVFHAFYQHEVSPASGVAALARKRNLLRKVRQALRATGIEPTMEQIAERANVEAATRLADPKRQGMVFTAESAAEALRWVQAARLDDAQDRDLALAAPTGSDTSPITASERRELVEAVIAEANQMPAPYPRVASLLWGRQTGEDTYEFPPVTRVAQAVGIGRKQATKVTVFLSQTLPQRILAERFGVRTAFAA